MLIVLNGESIPVGLPKGPLARSYAAEVLGLHGENPMLGRSAAIAICWQGQYWRPSPTLLSSMSLFGRQVLAELQEKGVPLLDIVRGGEECANLLASLCIFEAEVKKVENFTDRGKGGSPESS